MPENQNQKLIAFLQRNGSNLQELGRLLEASQRTISNWAKGRTPVGKQFRHDAAEWFAAQGWTESHEDPFLEFYPQCSGPKSSGEEANEVGKEQPSSYPWQSDDPLVADVLQHHRGLPDLAVRLFAASYSEPQHQGSTATRLVEPTEWIELDVAGLVLRCWTAWAGGPAAARPELLGTVQIHPLRRMSDEVLRLSSASADADPRSPKVVLNPKVVLHELRDLFSLGTASSESRRDGPQIRASSRDLLDRIQIQSLTHAVCGSQLAYSSRFRLYNTIGPGIESVEPPYTSTARLDWCSAHHSSISARERSTAFLCAADLHAILELQS